MKSRNRKNIHNVETSRRLLLLEDIPFAVKEAYFRLRQNLMFCVCKDKAQPCKTFAVTSASPAEGKSVVTTNIAISFAMLGKKTLVLDCDMRKPMQHKIWNIKVENGLSEHLSKIGELELCKVSEDIPLYIGCCNRVPSNPTAMLNSKSMQALIEDYYNQFDYIFIDTPPINMMADAQILASVVDGVVLVAKSGSTTRDEIKTATEFVRRSGGNFCGVVLNQIRLKTLKGGRYGYKNYSNYDYDYR